MGFPFLSWSIVIVSICCPRSSVIFRSIRVPLLLVLLFLGVPSERVWGGEGVAVSRQIVFMIGEFEYRTEETLPEFFQSELAAHGYEATFVFAPKSGVGKHDFAGLQRALPSADLLVLSVRRRAPKEGQLAAVRKHLQSGKPLVAIRTASHAFDARSDSPPGHAQWLGFDQEVLGAKYSGHYGSEPVQIRVSPKAAGDRLLRGVEPWQSSKLYKGELRSPTAQLLLVGQRPNGQEEPVAWTHRYGPRRARIFYTSLGVDSDFREPSFRQLLKNAVAWAMEPE